jgi:predicted CoA-substrate-specific enzyme activase
MRHTAGIDVGTGLTKAVLLAPGPNGAPPTVLARALTRTGVELEKAAARALELAREQAGLPPDEPCYVTTTGFGRYSVSFRDLQATEITSAARGAWFLFPQASCVLDIGSQSTRAIHLRDGGRVAAFKTNDKCAAGSGSFIARAAKYLQIPLEQVGELSLQAQNAQPISSICAVLAESEIINHVSAGVGVEDILRGIHDSLADRAANLLKRVGLGSELTFVGGVARQQGMVKALETRLGLKVNVPQDCEYVCALGAGLLGLKRMAAAA